MTIRGLKNLSYSAVTLVVVLTIPLSLKSVDSDKHLTPKCSAQIDPDNRQLILMVCDFSDVSVADKIIELKAHVVVTDSSGKLLGSQVLLFADKEEEPYRGGKKYSREFHHGIEHLPASNVTVKISGAEAVVVPEVDAIKH